ncbi:hypothetical protein N7366_00760 [Aeromonas caviae]|uniref:Uncharacterized protein n=2 Tax=Aeromonas caviae TaxID=648 RepID=A0AA42R7I3_AERCA|nr:hypothetical protein [Aeromonas caviae]MDH0431856.1 hypothetical protein [Aeromonas caviae]MDH1395508.1 hypothetical protein [Aeromonas caviae]MDH1504945.1 hypothetical protein [Aeromonas caviae]MDH1802688.1 hypothetical protein [Aeromonas caviae]MDH1847860.1 hypothetical protein [Aeromonas caviae]
MSIMMWFAKDGPRPHSQKGPGMSITSEEVQDIVGTREVEFVGAEPPSINPEHPSDSLKNVVLEIEEASDVSPLLPKVGFYFVVGLTPSAAENSLHIRRNLSSRQ